MPERVGFGKRLGAYLLDLVILWVLSFLLGGVFGGLMGGAAGTMMGTTDQEAMAGAAMGAVLGFLAAAAIIGCLYFLIEGLTGYTLGKFILGIRVANADGSQAGVGTLLTRWAVKNVSFLMTVIAALTGVQALGTVGNLLGLVVFIGFFFVLGANRQGFHDMLAKTAVYPKAMVRAAA